MAVDIDSLSDDDFLDMLENEDSYVEGTEEDSVDSTEDGIIDDEEGTDLADDESDIDDEDSETNDDHDGDDQDTDDELDVDDEVDAEENTLDGTDDDSTDEKTEPKADGDQKENEKVDYQSEYKKILEEKTKLEEFYNKVTGEFVANGKTVKGFNDPEKIIQSQQMALGFSDKMAKFKPYQPFMKPLKDAGLIDNPEKFNLMLDLAQGNKEALVKYLSDNEIDPYELTMPEENSEVAYEAKEYREPEIVAVVEDTLAQADMMGIRDTVEPIINDWDPDSVVEFLSDEDTKAGIMHHMKTSAYDDIQQRMVDKARIDYAGQYVAKPKIEQYRIAAKELAAEYDRMQLQNLRAPQETQQVVNTSSTVDVVDEVAKAEYEAEVRKKEERINAARKQASSVSRRKRSTTKKATTDFDPADLSEEEFTKMLDGFMYN